MAEEYGAVVVGSRAYGTPERATEKRPPSDLDLVVLVSPPRRTGCGVMGVGSSRPRPRSTGNGPSSTTARSASGPGLVPGKMARFTGCPEATMWGCTKTNPSSE